MAASPPAGFVPMAAPGKIIKVSKSDVLMPNGLFPKEDAARMMLERAMTELTGETDMGKAFARFVHKDDKVAIKMNGIAGQTGSTMATNKEIVLPIVAGVMAAGVPAANIVVYEQYTSFFNGTRVTAKNLPAGVVTAVHGNKDATMPEIHVLGIPTKFVRPLTEATAVINVALIKDHSICGYTGLPQEHDPRQHHQPARLPPAQRQPANRRALRPRHHQEPRATAHHRRLQAHLRRRPARQEP